MNTNKILLISLGLLLFGLIVIGGCTEPQQIQKSRDSLITANLSQLVTIDDFPEGWSCLHPDCVTIINTNPNYTAYVFGFDKGENRIQIMAAEWNTIEACKEYYYGIPPIPYRLEGKEINIGDDSAAFTGMAFSDPKKNLTITFINRNVNVEVDSSERDLENLKSWANLVNQRLENY